MADLTLSVNQSGTITAAFQGELGGVPPAQSITDPGQVVWTTSDPTILSLGTPTGLDTVPFTALKAGQVNLGISVPAAADAQFTYTAFSATKVVQVNPLAITVVGVTVTAG